MATNILPSQKEILRIHIMIIVLPFFSMIAWALWGASYQAVTIMLLMALFYIIPTRVRANNVDNDKISTGLL
jgi:hypothetical protein